MGEIRIVVAVAATMLAMPIHRAIAQPLPATPMLHLAATGSVQIPPDQLVAELVAQESAPAAAVAQRKVNALMADAMQRTQGVPDITARATDYAVFPSDEKHTGWTARQTLDLRGTDAPALLDLVGTLQERGLITASLEWRLSPAATRKAHDEATIAALRELQARAAAAAAALGVHLDHLQDVRLDGPVVTFQPQRPMMTMARLAAPPQATAAPQDIEATVSADFVLRP